MHAETFEPLLRIFEKRSSSSPETLEDFSERVDEYRDAAIAFSANAREAFSDLLGISSSDKVLEFFVASLVFASEANTMARLVSLGKA